MSKIGKISGYILIAGILLYFSCPGIGAGQKEIEMDKIKSLNNYKDGKFVNLENTPIMNPNSRRLKIMVDFFKKGNNRKPKQTIKTKKFNKDKFLRENNDIKVVWFGHSTLLININGVIILTDPFFSDRASPVSFVGTKKFAYSNEYIIDDLPDIDFVLISHDHYDHLDHMTIKALKSNVDKFIVPLGIAAHLKKWKVDPEKIIELNWSERFSQGTSVKITATPARHFSGRSFKRNITLWCSFVIKINNYNIYFSGDSGYGIHFSEIGRNYGPFDLTFLECGQYNENWPYIHMTPQETLKAHEDLKGKNLIPLHWAKLKLSLHSWTDPVEQLLKANVRDDNRIILPEIGEIVHPELVYENSYWWRE